MKKRHVINVTQTINTLSKQRDIPKSTRIHNALTEYSKINPNERDYHLINSILRLCVKLHHPQGIQSLWNDISVLPDKHSLDFLSLLKCSNLHQAIYGLQWMIDSKAIIKPRESKDFSINISKLISHRTSHITLHDLRRFESLTSNQEHLKNDIFIKTAFIKCYGTRFGAFDDALNVFHSVDIQNRDCVLLNSMMTVLIQNKRHFDAITLYDDHLSLQNVTSHLMALKALTVMNGSDRIQNEWALERGIAIHQKLENQEISNQKMIENAEISENPKISGDSTTNRWKTSVIDFYSKFGRIKDAETVFRGISHDEMNVFAVNAMIRGYIQNGDNHSALRLYREWRSLSNVMTDILAVRACINTNDWNLGKQIISKYRDGNMLESKLLSEVSESNKTLKLKMQTAMISFYGHFGDIDTAQMIFNGMQSSDISGFTVGVMMNTLITNGRHHNALELYRKFGHFHSVHLDTLALSACVAGNHFDDGISRELLGKYMDSDVISKSDINDKIYRKLLRFHFHFNAIDDAMKVFDFVADNYGNTKNVQKIFRFDHVVVELLQCLLDHNDTSEALSLYEEWKHHDQCRVNPKFHSLAVNACLKSSALDKSDKTREIETFLILQCDHNETAINALNSIISLYGDSDSSSDWKWSQSLFDRIPDDHKDYVTINSMMTVLLNHEQYQKVLSLHEMYCGNEDSLKNLKHFNETTHLLALKSCIKSGDFVAGQHLIDRYHLKDSSNIKIQTALIDFYGNSNDLNRALFIFDRIRLRKERDINIPIVSVNSIMTALLNHGEYERVKTLYNELECVMIGDDVTHLLLFKASLKTSDLDTGLRVHDVIGNHVQQSNALKVSLMEFYAHFGRIDDIQTVYNSVRSDRRNGILDRTLMNGLIQNGFYEKALEIYEHDIIRNQIRNQAQNEVDTHLLAIKCCTHSDHYEDGQQIIDHHKLERECVLKQDVPGMTILIQFYGHFGMIRNVERIFSLIEDQRKDLFLMNTMMNIYFTNNLDAKCLEIFNKLESPNMMSFVIALKSCTQSLLYREAQSIHSKLREDSYRDILSELSVQIELVNLYGKVGRMDMVQQIMDGFEQENGVMIVDVENVVIVVVDHACVKVYHVTLHAASSTSCLVSKQVSPYYFTRLTALTFKLQHHHGHDIILFSLQGGSTRNAEEIKIWNAFIRAFGRNGDLEGIKQIYHSILEDERLKPDQNTMVMVLNGCNHCGDVKFAESVWNGIMENEVKYDCFVVSAMVDCLSRSSKLHDAKCIIGEYEENVGEEQYHESMWMSLLNGFSVHDGDIQHAQGIFEEIRMRFSQNERFMSSASVLLSNIISNREKDNG